MSERKNQTRTRARESRIHQDGPVGSPPSSTPTGRTNAAGAKRGPILAGLVVTVAAAVLTFWSGWPSQSGGEASAASGDVLVAKSVCEAHELRARKEEDPSLQIEIPPEFDKEWPSANACESAVAAWDPETPGPIQPIPFSHKHHAGRFKIDCLYCHSGTDESQAAGVPPIETCMGCHSQFPPEYDEIEGIRILKEHWAKQEPIEWVQIHRLPEYVQFRHNRHVKAGVACQTCHGPVRDDRQALSRAGLASRLRAFPWRSSRWAGASIATDRTISRRRRIA